MKKSTLFIRSGHDQAQTPLLQRKGRGWAISESRLDTLHDTARELRRNPTAAQAALAEAFVRAQLGRYRFHRHVVIGSAIVDFACHPLKVVVQIDDPAKGDPAIDRRRDKSLEAVGMKVLRYPAAEVLADADAVAAQVFAEMKKSYDERRARPRPARTAARSGTNRTYQR